MLCSDRTMPTLPHMRYIWMAKSTSMWTRQALPSSAQSAGPPPDLHRSQASWNLDKNTKNSTKFPIFLQPRHQIGYRHFSILKQYSETEIANVLSQNMHFVSSINKKTADTHMWRFCVQVNNPSHLLSMIAWLSCWLSWGADSVSVERLRKEWVVSGTLLVLPLAVWQVSSPLYKSSGFWEKSSAVLPTNTTWGPGKHRFHSPKHTDMKDCGSMGNFMELESWVWTDDGKFHHVLCTSFSVIQWSPSYHIWWFYAQRRCRPCPHHKLQTLLCHHASCPTTLRW